MPCHHARHASPTTEQAITNKTNHCMKAIGNSEFCGCFAQNIFVNVTFSQYVEFFSFSPDEFDYQTLSPKAKEVYSNMRQTWDKFVKCYE